MKTNKFNPYLSTTKLLVRFVSIALLLSGCALGGSHGSRMDAKIEGVSSGPLVVVQGEGTVFFDNGMIYPALQTGSGEGFILEFSRDDIRGNPMVEVSQNGQSVTLKPGNYVVRGYRGKILKTTMMGSIPIISVQSIETSEK